MNAAKTFKNRKASGVDKLSKRAPKITEPSRNYLALNRSIPEEWHKSILIPIFKKK